MELNQVFSIEKDVWDAIHLDRIETASDPAKKVTLASNARAPMRPHTHPHIRTHIHLQCIVLSSLSSSSSSN